MSSLSLEKPIVYGLPVPPNTNFNQNPTRRISLGDKIALCIGILLPLGILLFLTVYMTFSSITHDKVPKVHVDDVTLTRFMLSPTNNTLYYNLAANMTFRNPYSQVGIHFDKIDANLMFQGQKLGTKVIPDVFYLHHKKEKSIVNVVLTGEHLLWAINGDEKLVYASENKNGVYNIGLKVRLAMRSKAMSVNNYREKYEIMCDNLEVPLNSEGKVSSAKFNSTKCSYKELDDKSF